MLSFFRKLLHRKPKVVGKDASDGVKEIGGGDATEKVACAEKPKVKYPDGTGFFKRFFRPKTRSKCHIDKEYAKKNMKHIRRLGCGSFGTVSLIVDKSTGVKMALKVQRQSDSDLIELALQEAKFSKILSRHPLFAQHFGSFAVSTEHAHKEFHLFMEYVQQCWTLDVFFEKHYRISEQYQFVAWQVVEAMRYLHTKKITHRDVKPENILINSKCLIKVIDLGVAARGNRVWKTIGTPGYMAPEVEEAHVTRKPYGMESDYYSVGATLYHAIFSEAPKPDLLRADWKAISSEEQEQKLDDAFVFGAPKETANLLNELLNLEPKERLRDKQILSHPFFHDIQEFKRSFVSGGIFAMEKPNNSDPWATMS